MKKKLANNVSHFYISKPFFKTCLYKLEYNFSGNKPAPSSYVDRWGSSTAQLRREMWNKTQAFSRAVKRFATEQGFDIRVRAESGTASVFVQTEANALAVINKYRTNLHAIWMPYNESQVTMICDDLTATLIFRKTLFGASSSTQGYRYKVQCKVTSEVEDSWANVNNFVSTLDQKSFKANENWNRIPKGHLSYWNTFSMYFNDEQDIMMLKLMLGSKDFKLQKAVLYSELE